MQGRLLCIENNSNCAQNIRLKDVKSLIGNKQVMVNGNIINKSDFKVNPDIDIIEVSGEVLKVQKYIYLILNKPKGYVSATVDKTDRTVLDLVPFEYSHRDLFPAGRLDKDTTGLMIMETLLIIFYPQINIFLKHIMSQ